MPTLPTLNVTTAQATRLTAAFGSIDAYKAALKQWLIDEVRRRELQILADSQREVLNLKSAEIESDFSNVTTT